MSTQCQILGVRIDGPSLSEVVALCRTWLSGDIGHQIATVNPEFIMAAQQDEQFNKVLNESDLTVADGAGLIAMSRLCYGKECRLSRVTGVDLTWELARLCADMGKSIYLVGGKSKEVVVLAKKKMEEVIPNLSIVGVEAGESSVGSGRPVFKEFESDQAMQDLLGRIRAAKPDVLLVAYGAPKQDVWISQCLKQLPGVKIAMGVGGTFDYVSGEVVRAPHWMRSIGLEWLFRLIMQPRRFNRIITATIRFPLKVLFVKIFK